MSILDRHYFKEYQPLTDQDVLLEKLRDIFITSFNDYYSHIAFCLHLPDKMTTEQWLSDLFKQVTKNLVEKQSRCYLLTIGPLKSDIRGIIIFRQDPVNTNTIFVQQCAMHPEFKRHGFGRIAFEKFLGSLSSVTIFEGVCRRVNRPALFFYMYLGIQLMESEEIVTKHGYDPKLYVAFQYSRDASKLAQSKLYKKTIAINEDTLAQLTLTSIKVQPLHSVEEYFPKMDDKETMKDIRKLYIEYLKRAYYKKEDQLKLSANQNLNEWLSNNFDQIKKDLLDGTCRCFLLYFGEKVLMGLLIIKELHSKIYITEFVLKATQRLQQFEKGDIFKHLNVIFPTTTYRFICRMLNDSDIDFLTNTLCGKMVNESNILSQLNFDPSEFVCVEVDSKDIK